MKCADRCCSLARPPSHSGFHPSSVRPNSFVKKNLPLSPTARGFCADCGPYLQWNEEFAKRRGEGVQPRQFPKWERPEASSKPGALGSPFCWVNRGLSALGTRKETSLCRCPRKRSPVETVRWGRTRTFPLPRLVAHIMPAVGNCGVRANSPARHVALCPRSLPVPLPVR